MSYALHLWSQTHRPESYAQAESMLERLRETPEPETEAAFRALVDQVSRHYGQVADEDGSFAWNEIPEFRQQALLTLGLVSGELATALPLILTAARQLGLAVLDIQCGEVWLPEGLVLEADGSRRVGDIAELEPADCRELSDFNVAESIRTVIEPALTALGFQRGRGESWFVRKTAAFKVSLEARIKWNHLSLWMPIELKAPKNRPELKTYCEDWSLTVDFQAIAKNQGLRSNIHFEEPLHQLQTADWAQVRNTETELASLLSSSGAGFLGSIQSVSDLNHWCHEVSDANCPFHFVRGRTAENGLHDFGTLYRSTHADLLIALLAGNPKFVELATTRIRLCRAGLQPVGERAAQGIEKFMKAVGHAV